MENLVKKTPHLQGRGVWLEAPNKILLYNEQIDVIKQFRPIIEVGFPVCVDLLIEDELNIFKQLSDYGLFNFDGSFISVTRLGFSFVFSFYDNVINESGEAIQEANRFIETLKLMRGSLPEPVDAVKEDDLIEKRIKMAEDFMYSSEAEGLYAEGPVYSESGFTYDDVRRAIRIAAGKEDFINK